MSDDTAEPMSDSDLAAARELCAWAEERGRGLVSVTLAEDLLAEVDRLRAILDGATIVRAPLTGQQIRDMRNREALDRIHGCHTQEDGR